MTLLNDFVCAICSSNSSICSEAKTVLQKTNKKDYYNFDSIVNEFCDNNRNLFDSQNFTLPKRPIRSLDILYSNNTPNCVSLVEVKATTARSVNQYLGKIKEKYLDSLYVLSHIRQGWNIKKWTIALPDNYMEISRLRLSIPAFFSPTQNIDDAYYFNIRGSLFSTQGKKKTFSYIALVPKIKACRDAFS